MKDITLVIMAAGMGSRFGGLKQIEPIGPNNEFIIDYSVYDAKQAGFNKIVFIIKKENYQIFKETIGKRVEPHIKTEYVFQTNEIFPKEYQQLLAKREKPLGTTHAIYCAKDKVHEPFAVINADDFYGRDAYLQAAKYLQNPQNSDYAIVGYELQNTLSPNGATKRGVCQLAENNNLASLIESNVELVNGQIEATPLDGKEKFIAQADSICSMNFLLFYPSLFERLNQELTEFLEENKNDLTKCETLIPVVLNKYISTEKMPVKVVKTTANWYGVTYKEDKEEVTKAIQELITNKIYPYNLWEK